MKSKITNPGKLFWAEFSRHVVIGPGNTIAFTASGRAEYGPLFSRHGKRLDDIVNLTEFKSALDYVNAREFERKALSLDEGLQSPDMTESDKAFIRTILGLPAPTFMTSSPEPKKPKAHVVDLAEWKKSRNKA